MNDERLQDAYHKLVDLRVDIVALGEHLDLLEAQANLLEAQVKAVLEATRDQRAAGSERQERDHHPRTWKWFMDGDRHILRPQKGGPVFADVTEGGARHYWMAFDEDGIGGENSDEQDLRSAQWCADRAARVWWYERQEGAQK